MIEIYPVTKEEWIDILFNIYQVCKKITGWKKRLAKYHDDEDMKYFERLSAIDRNFI